MSLFQAWIEPERALVAVDTLAYDHNHGGISEVLKMAALPHAQCVMACRGSQHAFLQLLAHAWLAPGYSTYDKLAACVPQLVEWASAQFPESLPDAIAQCELTLVGWSDAGQRMAGTSYVVDLKANTCQAQGEIDYCRVGPAVVNKVPAEFDDALALKVARLQVAWVQDNAPDQATGGRLLIAELSRREIVIRDAGKIET